MGEIHSRHSCMLLSENDNGWSVFDDMGHGSPTRIQKTCRGSEGLAPVERRIVSLQIVHRPQHLETRKGFSDQYCDIIFGTVPNDFFRPEKSVM
jgi:hypothetical protein